MKVLIVSHYFPPHVGGIEFVAQNQARFLASRPGSYVTVLTSAVGSRHGIEGNKNGYTIHRLNALNFFEDKFKIPFPVFSPRIIVDSYKLVKENDVIHIHDSFYVSSTVVAFWAFLLKRPVVLTQHVEISPYPQKIVRGIQKAVYKTTGKFVFKVAGRIIVLNSSVKAFLITNKVDPRKIVVLPNSVDATLFYPGNNKETDKLRNKYGIPLNIVAFIFVGRFIRLKGFYKLLKAANKKYVIIFVGGKSPKGYSKNKHFVFLGSLNHLQLSEVYRACDGFILPSDGEGFPLTMQEAMSSGLPIITNSDTGYDIYNFDHTRVKFIEPTVSNIKKVLLELTMNSRLRDKMSRYSVHFARKNFDQERNTNQLVDLYQELLG